MQTSGSANWNKREIDEQSDALIKQMTEQKICFIRTNLSRFDRDKKEKQKDSLDLSFGKTIQE